jgi:D-3-phosphoglycerate dehydrogenase
MHVTLTSDFVGPDGRIKLGEEPLARLRAIPGIEISTIAGRPTNHPLEARDVTACDILIGKRNRLDADLLGLPGFRLKHIARMGVGYDHLDLDACTRAGVLVTITREAVKRPLASAMLALMLALAHRLFERDRLARRADWATRFAIEGVGLGGRTLGLLGAGNIGAELIRLVQPFGMRVLVHDPGLSPDTLAQLGAASGSLDEVVRQADFLMLACSLNERTKGLINAARLAQMKPTAFLVNLARGELVEEAALVEALACSRVAGAGIDVFEHEPPARDNPLLGLPNVILGQHNLGMTDELDRLGQMAAVDAVIEVARGNLPASAVNPEAWSQTLQRFAR